MTSRVQEVKYSLTVREFLYISVDSTSDGAMSSAVVRVLVRHNEIFVHCCFACKYSEVKIDIGSLSPRG